VESQQTTRIEYPRHGQRGQKHSTSPLWSAEEGKSKSSWTNSKEPSPSDGGGLSKGARGQHTLDDLIGSGGQEQLAAVKAIDDIADHFLTHGRGAA